MARKAFRVSASIVALGGVVLTSLSGCATPVQVDPEVVAQTVLQLGVVYERINGTPKQRRAGELTQYHLYQDTVVQCMRTKGFGYSPPPFVDIYAGLADLRGLSGTWYAEPSESGLGVAESVVRLTPLDTTTSNPGFEGLDSKGQQRYDEALTGCTPRDTPDVYIPDSSARQNGKLFDLLAEIEQRPEVAVAIKDYRACLRRDNLKADNPDQVIEQLQQVFGKVPDEAIGKADRPEWAAAVQAERTAAAIDANCRKSVREISAMLLREKLAKFEQDNAAGIQQAQVDWDDLVAQARKYPEAAALGLR